MDDICVWLEKVLRWVERSGPPRIPFAGQARSGFANPPRQHLELVCLLEGGFPDLRLGDRRVSFPAGHISLHSVHHGNHGRPASGEPGLLCWCVFLDVADEPDFAGLAAAPLFCLMPLVHREQVVEAFARLAVRCAQLGDSRGDYPESVHFDRRRDARTGSAARVYVQAALLDLLAVLIDEAHGTATTLKPIAVQAAVEFISLHYADPDLSLARIAAAGGLSQDHFGRLFRQHLGAAPMQHLKRVRIDQSRFLLAHTSQRIEDVAYACGFTDQFHFSRVFRAQIGVSPLAFRRRTA